MTRQKPSERAALELQITVTDLVIAGFDADQITKFLADLQHRGDLPGQPPTAAQLGAMMKRAGKLIAARAAGQHALGDAVALVRLNNLYAKCVAASEFEVALAVHREIEATQARIEKARLEGATETAAPAALSFADRYRANLRGSAG